MKKVIVIFLTIFITACGQVQGTETQVAATTAPLIVEATETPETAVATIPMYVVEGSSEQAGEFPATITRFAEIDPTNLGDDKQHALDVIKATTNEVASLFGDEKVEEIHFYEVYGKAPDGSEQASGMIANIEVNGASYLITTSDGNGNPVYLGRGTNPIIYWALLRENGNPNQINMVSVMNDDTKGNTRPVFRVNGMRLTGFLPFEQTDQAAWLQNNLSWKTGVRAMGIQVQSDLVEALKSGGNFDAINGVVTDADGNIIYKLEYGVMVKKEVLPRYEVRADMAAEQNVQTEYAGIPFNLSIITANHFGSNMTEVSAKPGTESQEAEAVAREWYKVWKQRGGKDENGPDDDIDFKTFMQWWKEARTGVPTREGESPHTWEDVQVWCTFFYTNDIGEPVVKPIWLMYDGVPPEGVVVINHFSQKLVNKEKVPGMATAGTVGRGWRLVVDGNEMIAEIGLPMNTPNPYYNIRNLSASMSDIGSLMIQDHGQRDGFAISNGTILKEAYNIYRRILLIK